MNPVTTDRVRAARAAGSTAFCTASLLMRFTNRYTSSLGMARKRCGSARDQTAGGASVSSRAPTKRFKIVASDAISVFFLFHPFKCPQLRASRRRISQNLFFRWPDHVLCQDYKSTPLGQRLERMLHLSVFQ